MSTLPKDPMILLSYINTQLRDNLQFPGRNVPRSWIWMNSISGKHCLILALNMCLKKIVSVRMRRFYLNKGVQVRPVLSLVPPLKGAENR